MVLEKISPCTHPFEKVLMIGDRLDTDIEFGNAAGKLHVTFLPRLLISLFRLQNFARYKDRSEQ